MNDVKPERPSLREAQRSLTREQLMAGARACFLRKAYSEVSVEEIAAEARVSRATFYNHFVDKKALFAEMIDHYLKPIGRSYEALLRLQPGSAAEVAQWVASTFEQREPLKDDIRIAQQAGIADAALGQQFFEVFADVVLRVLPMAMLGRPESERPRVHLRVWIASRALENLFSEIVVQGRPLDRAAGVAELARLWCDALGLPLSEDA